MEKARSHKLAWPCGLTEMTVETMVQLANTGRTVVFLVEKQKNKTVGLLPKQLLAKGAV